ncbi:MAG: Txe/YoeB family addiction module toxin [Bacteroidetes bacterium HGW-Bacteroidetes-4]|jgi:toxin YoeB|nr:MAG: Txe/YoeB family addiction module toxin [Bacteroidetes bacterium HGW-Bacteroidetes-4]
MIITFTENAWDDYLYWQKTDKKAVKKINSLLKEIRRTPFEGTGKPEALKYDLSGYWSRRLENEHRLVYQVSENEIIIYACRFHYD